MTAAGNRFELDRVTVEFGGKPALRGVTAFVAAGDIVALVGPSGGGKTSLLRLLNGTLRPTRGRVLVGDRDLRDRTPRELKTLRTRIGFVHQDLSLVPNVRVATNVLAGRLGRVGFLGSIRTMLRPPAEDLAEVHALLERVGIPEKLFERTDRLSGGQRQRVAIARALYQDATTLLVDEPVASLDPARSRDTIELLASIARERGATLLASMHDVALAREFFPRLIGLRSGVVQFDQRSADVDAGDLDTLYRLAAAEMWDDGC